MKLSRRARYYYLRFIRLRGEPHELALGMAFGIFTAMMPIIPFHMALAVALALVFKGSKITAALGTWISNPLNWYIIYYLDYRIGAFVLDLSRDNRGFSSLMESIRNAGEGMTLMKEIIGASSTILGAFLIGGLIIGVVVSIPSYFLFLKLFRSMKSWRKNRNRERQ